MRRQPSTSRSRQSGGLSTSPARCARRRRPGEPPSMNIHEYQAKELLAKYGVPVPQGGVAYTADEAVGVARRIGGKVWVVKAQIHAGGRGKAGGVKLVRSEDEVAAAATALMGKKLVTHQTGAEGREVKRVYVEAGCDIARELYLALSIDRATGRITLIAAAGGGGEVEGLGGG